VNRIGRLRTGRALVTQEPLSQDCIGQWLREGPLPMVRTQPQREGRLQEVMTRLQEEAQQRLQHGLALRQGINGLSNFD
jgi:hypothetical protein